jgi:hypothetical protein
LFTEKPHLERIFEKCIFPAAALNFGPRVSSYKHRDSLNCSFGWCAIQALGYFDSSRSAPLILWEFGIMVEFPPWALVYIPSATVTHSNGVLENDEYRASFTLFCAGGLLRYVDNSFRTDKEFLETDPEGFKEMSKEKATRWEKGLQLFTNYDDIDVVKK